AKPQDARRLPAAVDHFETFDDLDGLLPEWRALYGRVASRNPFANPDWIAPWLRAFLPSGDLRVVTVRARDELRAVAPFYVARTRGKGVLPTMRFELPGTGIHSNLPELPEVLTEVTGR